jgi:hypothetical protein
MLDHKVKMRNKKYIAPVLLSFLVLINTAVRAQNYMEDMQKVRASYVNSPRSFNMKYAYYPYDSVNKAIDSMHGSCTVSGSSYYYKVSSGTGIYEYIKNEKYYLVIDHPNKAVAVNSSAKARQDLWNINRVDSLLKTPAVKVEYKSLGKGKGQYDVNYTEASVWKRTRIVFDKTNYSLCEVWLYSDAKGKIQGEPYSKPKIGIIYSEPKGNIPDKNIFSEKRFIEDKGNAIVLTEEYKKYRLLNYINQEKKS